MKKVNLENEDYAVLSDNFKYVNAKFASACNILFTL